MDFLSLIELCPCPSPLLDGFEPIRGFPPFHPCHPTPAPTWLRVGTLHLLDALFLPSSTLVSIETLTRPSPDTLSAWNDRISVLRHFASAQPENEVLPVDRWVDFEGNPIGRFLDGDDLSLALAIHRSVVAQSLSLLMEARETSDFGPMASHNPLRDDQPLGRNIRVAIACGVSIHDIRLRTLSGWPTNPS